MENNTDPLCTRERRIFAGNGIMRTIMGGHVFDNLPPPPPVRLPSTECFLRIYNASTESGFAIKFTFGTIAGRRPTGFNTQGLVTALPVANDGDEHHFFAEATLDPTTLQWYSSQIIEKPWDVVNTNTKHYTLKGVAQVIDNHLVISDPICGNVNPDICELASDYTP